MAIMMPEMDGNYSHVKLREQKNTPVYTLDRKG
jgi:DNA-binding response OmpR family regulator